MKTIDSFTSNLVATPRNASVFTLFVLRALNNRLHCIEISALSSPVGLLFMQIRCACVWRFGDVVPIRGCRCKVECRVCECAGGTVTVMLSSPDASDSSPPPNARAPPRSPTPKSNTDFSTITPQHLLTFVCRNNRRLFFSKQSIYALEVNALPTLSVRANFVVVKHSLYFISKTN